MKTSGNTVLITGGSAGIGLEIAKLLSAQGNQVIITGRDPERLARAAAQLHNATAIVSDVSKQADINALVKTLTRDFPRLNLVINNAGRAFAYRLSGNAGAFEKAADEMLTNYLSVAGLTEQLLPLLTRQETAGIVNVTSIVAFAPFAGTPTYGASKAALHSYTQSLRITFPALHVFELMPPLVNTDFSQEIGGSNGIPPQQVAAEFLTALEHDQYEIHVGGTEAIYQLMLSSPEAALAAINTGREA